MTYLNATVLSFFVLLFLLKLYFKLKSKWCTNKVCFVGKTIIVTGANTGIGYETALEFAKRGARVILACRDESRANEAQSKIIKETQNRNVVVRLLDMSSLKSVRNFAKEVLETEERLDVLVNNAGVCRMKATLSEDRLDYVMQVNYFGPFLLTILLIGLLKESAQSRIVNISSRIAARAKLDVDRITEYPGPLYLYSNSKLCQILFTIHLARLLEGTNVTVYSVHPGHTATNILRLQGFRKYVSDFVMLLFFKTPLEGAQTTIYTATEQNIEAYSGRLFKECHVIKTYKTATHDDLPKKLWAKTVELLKCEKDVKNFLFL